MESRKRTDIKEAIQAVFSQADRLRKDREAWEAEQQELTQQIEEMGSQPCYAVMKMGLTRKIKELTTRIESIKSSCDEIAVLEKLSPFVIESAMLMEKRYRDKGSSTKTKTHTLPENDMHVENMMPNISELRESDMHNYVTALLPLIEEDIASCVDDERMHTLTSLRDKLLSAERVKNSSYHKSKAALVTEMGRVFDLEGYENYEDIDEICKECGTLLLVLTDESRNYCPTCLKTTDIIDYTNFGADKHKRREKRQESNKGEAQFNKQLMCGQYKETTHVPGECIQSLKTECLRRIKKGTLVTRSHVKVSKLKDLPFDAFHDLVHDLRNNKQFNIKRYYINIQQMWCRVTGNDPFRFTSQEENIIRLIHAAVSRVIADEENPSRKTAIKAQFQIHMMCQFLRIDRALEYFQPLKVEGIRTDRESLFKSLLHKAGFTNTVFRYIRDRLRST